SKVGFGDPLMLLQYSGNVALGFPFWMQGFTFSGSLITMGHGLRRNHRGQFSSDPGGGRVKGGRANLEPALSEQSEFIYGGDRGNSFDSTTITPGQRLPISRLEDFSRS